MKNFFENFLDFITGGFFNYLGAMARAPFSKRSFKELVPETLSNNIGMVVMTILLAILYFIYKYISPNISL